MAEFDSWIEAQEFQITLDAHGRIIDFLNEELRRPNTPEERIRQKMAQTIHHELGYPKNVMALERPINIGREIKRAGDGFRAVFCCTKSENGRPPYLTGEFLL